MWNSRKSNAGLGSRIGGAVKGATKGAVKGGATGSVVGGLAGGGVATPVTGAIGGAVGSTLGAAKGAVKGFFKKPTQKTQSPAVPQRQASSEACPRIGNSEELWKKHEKIKEAVVNRPSIAGIIRPTRAGEGWKKVGKGAAIGGVVGGALGAAHQMLKDRKKTASVGIIAGRVPVNAKINWKKAAAIGAGVGLAGLGAGLAINKKKTGSFLPVNKNTSATPKPSTTGTYVMSPAEHKQVMKEVSKMSPHGDTYTMSPKEHKQVMKQVKSMGQTSKASAPGLTKDAEGIYHGTPSPRLTVGPNRNFGKTLWKNYKLTEGRKLNRLAGKLYYVRHNPEHNTYELRKISKKNGETDPVVKIFHTKEEAIKARKKWNALSAGASTAALGGALGLLGKSAYDLHKSTK